MIPNDLAGNHALDSAKLSQVNIEIDISQTSMFHDALGIEIIKSVLKQIGIANATAILDLIPQGRIVTLRCANAFIIALAIALPRKRGDNKIRKRKIRIAPLLAIKLLKRKISRSSDTIVQIIHNA